MANLILSTLSQTSKPISRLVEAEALSAPDLFIVAREEEPAQQSFSARKRNKIDKMLAAKGITKSSIVYDEAFKIANQLVTEGWKLQYSHLSNQLMSDISARLSVNTMAFKENWEYSKANHSHPYSTVRCFPAYTYDDVLAQYSELPAQHRPHDLDEWIATVEIHQLSGDQYVPISTDLFAPHIEFPLYPDPDIGEVRFLAQKSLPTASTDNPKLVTIYSANDMLFDSENQGYWVYPHGQTITCPSNEFKEACQVYGETKSQYDTKFTLPDLRNFIKMNPGATYTNAMQYIAFQNGVPSHGHSLDNSSVGSSSNKLTANIVINTCNCNGKSTDEVYIHSGSGKPNNLVNHISADITLTNIMSQPTQTAYSDASLDRETYPRYITMPLIVYIGRRH